MAAGKIVACRDMEPINGFVQHEVNGFFLAFDGSKKDLDVVRRIAGLDPDRCTTMSEAAQTTAKRYDWDSVARQFTEHYNTALNGG